MLNKAKILKNCTLNCLDGEIGKVKDFYFDDQTWTIRYLIVNTGIWLIGKQVLVSPHAIVSVDQEKEHININLTKKQIENSPLLESDKPVSQQFQKQFYEHFAYPMYSLGLGAGSGGNILPLTPIETVPTKNVNNTINENDWDTHLRSTQTVSGYGIQAINDKIGHVDDFIIDDESWIIQYLDIDTTNWLQGKKILISPKWIDHVSWNESLVFVNISSDKIKMSPEYTDESIIDRDFEMRLHEHYNQKGYWLNEQEVNMPYIK